MLLNVADLTPKCCVNTDKDLALPRKAEGPARLSVGCDG